SPLPSPPFITVEIPDEQSNLRSAPGKALECLQDGGGQGLPQGRFRRKSLHRLFRQDKGFDGAVDLVASSGRLIARLHESEGGPFAWQRSDWSGRGLQR